MIKIFDSNETDFSTNGNIVINPLKCIETKKKSLNGWYIDVEIPIKFKEYIEQDKLCVIKTKSKLNPQAFSINNIEYTNNRIKFTAEHIAFRARDYFLVDCRPTKLDGNNALNYINERTDNNSPFNIVSDVETISTAYLIRKNLLEAWEIIEEKWGGTFDFDNYTVYFKQKVGVDNGVIISYGKNLQGFRVYEDWSNVVTKLYPVGFDGLMLPEGFLSSEINYNKNYTKCVSFDTDIEFEEQTEENLINELRLKAQNHLLENQYPKVSYEITSNIVQNIEIGDTIHVKHPLVMLNTEAQEYEYNSQTEKLQKLVFGNYNRDVKTKFDSIKNAINNAVSKVSTQDEVIANQTKIINSLNKTGHLYIDDNELFILDVLPKENAKNVLRLGLGGLGLSENGIEGPFTTAITPFGINADTITSGKVKASRIEGYEQLVTTVNGVVDTSNNTVKRLEEVKTSTEQQINIINETFENGVPKVKTTSGTFDENGLNVSKSGEEMQSLVTNEGVYVNRDKENILTADSSGVNAINLHARQYLSIGTHSRWEDYEDGTGCFDMN